MNIAQKSYLIDSNKKIETVLDEIFGHLENYLHFIGKIIVSEDIKSKMEIADLLKRKAEAVNKSKAIYSWTAFDWINNSGMMTITTKLGVLKQPINMLHRTYASNALKYPWKLFFSDPAYGIPSNEYIIPTGYGVGDKSGTIGILATGISIRALTDKLQDNFVQQNVVYIILNNKFKIITLSPNIDNHNGQASNFIENLNLINIMNQDNIPINIKYKNFEFHYAKSLKNYPFIILTGFDINKLKEEMIYKLIPRISEIIFMCFISIVLLYYFRRRLINPIIYLSQYASQIITQSIAAPKIEQFKYYKEIEILYNQLKVIDHITDELMHNKNKVEKLNEELEEKIAERTAELEKALAVRTEILNNVNHEIRTPLHGFSIIAKELANNWDDFSNKKRKLLASQVSSNVIRLEKLIYNLLDLSILSNGKTILHYEVTDFNNLISAMIEESIALYMGDKQIEIISLTDDKLTVNIDQEKINQVLRNLIINAIRFSPPQAKIIIKAEIIGSNLHFYIKDQGLGVPEEELESIFNIFTQSSRTKTGAGGTGLGLSICKKIIESHQGKIWAENNIDIGTAFHFVIPRNIEEEKRERKEKRNAIILMIDDEEICHMGMELLLKDSGYRLLKANSGEHGKKIIEKEKIDLILLDIMMPEVNGIEFLKELRASGNEIPVIMQSGAVNAEEMLEDQEIAGLITKPYKKEKVIKIIDSVVGSMQDNLNNKPIS